MAERSTRVLVLGAAGMLGHVVLRTFADSAGYEAYGAVRRSPERLPAQSRARLLDGMDVRDDDALERLFREIRPDVVINCVGVVKQLAEADDPLVAIPINSLLPH